MRTCEICRGNGDILKQGVYHRCSETPIYYTCPACLGEGELPDDAPHLLEWEWAAERKLEAAAERYMEEEF